MAVIIDSLRAIVLTGHHPAGTGGLLTTSSTLTDVQDSIISIARIPTTGRVLNMDNAVTVGGHGLRSGGLRLLLWWRIVASGRVDYQRISIAVNDNGERSIRLVRGGRNHCTSTICPGSSSGCTKLSGSHPSLIGGGGGTLGDYISTFELRTHC